VSRNIVMGTGAAALLLGGAAFIPLPVDWAYKLPGMAAWGILGARDLWLIASGYKRCERIRVHHDGSVQVWGADGRCTPAALTAGSIVTSGLAWLRLGRSGGGQYRLLLRRKAAENKDWRRLQVIWRHLGAAD
jgi:hypothetical protein